MNCRPAEQRIEMDSHEVGDLTIHIEARPVRERISIAMIPYLPMQNLKISYYCSLSIHRASWSSSSLKSVTR